MFSNVVKCFFLQLLGHPCTKKGQVICVKHFYRISTEHHCWCTNVHESRASKLPYTISNSKRSNAQWKASYKWIRWWKRVCAENIGTGLRISGIFWRKKVSTIDARYHLLYPSPSLNSVNHPFCKLNLILYRVRFNPIVYLKCL